MKKISKKYFGFTLVELIIVITILAILATVAFVSFQNYTSQTRDTKRVADLSQISKGVEVFQVGAGIAPTPDNPKTLTGGNSTLLVGKINSKVLKSLSNNILDPVSGTEYTYATIGNGKYYQIGADSENLVTSIFQNTFADAKSSIVKGNYLFDPSLPSLIISSGSILYDPNNCFVVNGGTNLISNNTNCTSKASTSLKNFDSSLVGYWDMESLTGTMLKDLSGNGNNGTFSGGMVYSSALIGGVSGNALSFSGNTTIGDFIEINNSSGIIKNLNNYTISLIYKENINCNKRTGLITQYSSTFTSEPNLIAMRYAGTGSIQYYQTTNTLTGTNLNVLIDDGKIQSFTSISGSLFLTANKSLNKNNYKIITIIYNKKESNQKMYINGIIVANNYLTYGLDGNNIGNVLIGKSIKDGYFSGNIDDTKIYNRVLSDEEILQQAKSAGF